MAKAPTVAVRWIPEDDLLLKNAVEGGASLEALAKGAVLFSRRFTLRELRDRWHSLLYDPDISDQSSADMFELEISGFNPSSRFIRSESNLKGIKEISQKRKLESIRRKYYAMRKKFRAEFFRNSDLGLFEPDSCEFSGLGTDFQKQVTLDGRTGQNCILGDSISDDLRLQEEDLDILRHAFPETVRDIAGASDTTNASQSFCPRSIEQNCPGGILGRYGFDENVSQSLPGTGNSIVNSDIENRNDSLTLTHCSRNENTRNVSVEYEGLPFKTTKSDDYSFQEIAFVSEQPHLRHLRLQDISTPPVPGMCLQDVDQVSDNMLHDSANGQINISAVHTVEFADPDSLLNLSNENEILLMDVEEMHSEDLHCSNNITPVIQDSNIDNQENDVVVNIEAATVSETNVTLSPTESLLVLEATASSAHGEELIKPHSMVNVSLKSFDITELNDGKICCMLNSEDTEIPCNDDIFLLIHPSTSYGSSVTQVDIRGSVGASDAAHGNGKNYEQIFNFPTKSKDCMNAFGGTQKVGVHRSPESHSTDQLIGVSAKIQMADNRNNTLFPEVAYKANGDPSKGGLANIISNTTSNRFTEKEISRVAVRVRESPSTVAFPESVANSSASDQEETFIDAEMPYFSDIEAMILEMDLDPYEQESVITRQAASCMCDDTKRTVIRLEQGARSCFQRVMMSQGALAVLYGRHLRHFIRKPEVVLGRSTEDVEVDIDLREEGRANKISRRQAIIKMEADGSFFLKNFGKSSVSVNGMTIETGEFLSLSSSCLIEIKGMSFVFEINERYVKQNLVNFGHTNRKSIKFEQFT